MKNLPASAMRSNGADYVRTYHHVEVDQTVSLADLLRPNFWVHHANALRRGDLIDVFGDHIDLHLRVVGKGVGLVEVRPLAIWQAEDAGNAPVEAGTTDDLPDIPDGYEVKRGPRGRWKVLTKDPLLEIAKEIMTEVEARNIALAHYVKANKVAA